MVQLGQNTKSSVTKICSATLCILLAVLIIMQFTDEVNWGIADFLIAALLLIIIFSCLELIRQKVKNKNLRFLLIIIAILVFFLIWAELAVGIFGF